jgi:hypothetical protein
MSRQHIRIIQHLHKLRREQSANMSAGAERDHVRQDHAEYLVAVTRLRPRNWWPAVPQVVQPDGRKLCCRCELPEVAGEPVRGDAVAAFWRTRWRRSAEIVVLWSATGRWPAAVLGAAMTRRPSYCWSCWQMSAVPAVRSTSDQCRPAASPRRTPRSASRW